jgi:hypothetical protein
VHNIATERVALELSRAAPAERKIVLQILTLIGIRHPVILDCHSFPNCLYPQNSVDGKAIPVISGHGIALSPSSTDQACFVKSEDPMSFGPEFLDCADLRTLDAKQTKTKDPRFGSLPSRISCN